MAPYTIAVVEGLATVHPDHESAVLFVLPFGKPVVVAVIIVIRVDITLVKLVSPQCMLGLKRDSTGQMRAHQMLMHASISSVELLREISIWI